VSTDLPLITDTTELISPETAYEMLLKNKNNRPINWKKVEEYAVNMKNGAWELHAQGIILDKDGNVLTGQKRLWAVIYSNASVHMRVSRGSPTSSAKLIDRHTPQSARDLASRGTGEKHSPVETSLARGILVSKGNLRPSTDELAQAIEINAVMAKAVLEKTVGTKKTKAVLMLLAAICASGVSTTIAQALTQQLENMASDLETSLQPQSAEGCWGRGAAFSLAMAQARKIVAARRG
jgi:hypothetical protein